MMTFVVSRFCAPTTNGKGRSAVDPINDLVAAADDHEPGLANAVFSTTSPHGGVVTREGLRKSNALLTLLVVRMWR